MTSKEIKKEYSNGEVAITWEPHKCIHSGNCVKGLPGVFDINKKPWINAEGASSSEIVNQIKACPSGALGYYMEDEKVEDDLITEDQIVEVIPNGPLMVYGNVKVKMPDGDELSKSKVTAFCRCGGSKNKPFCDGNHKKLDFKG